MNEVVKSFGWLSKFVAKSNDEQEMLCLIERQEMIVADNPDLISSSSVFRSSLFYKSSMTNITIINKNTYSFITRQLHFPLFSTHIMPMLRLEAGYVLPRLILP